jgi:hypothetical protein
MSAGRAVDERTCAHLKACEETLLDAAVRRDPAQVAALLAEDFREIGSSGRFWSREEILKLLAEEEYTAPAMEDFQCARISEGVVLVTYRTVRVDARSGLRAAVLRSSIWTRESDAWRVRFHQGTRVP